MSYTPIAIAVGVALVLLMWAFHISGHRRRLVKFARDVAHAEQQHAEGMYASPRLRGYARAVLARVGEH